MARGPDRYFDGRARFILSELSMTMGQPPKFGEGRRRIKIEPRAANRLHPWCERLEDRPSATIAPKWGEGG
jgi:hypothetical protein